MTTPNTPDEGAESRAKLEQWVASGRVLCAMVQYGSPWFRFSYVGRLTKQGEGTFYIFLPVEKSDSGFIGFDFNTVQMDVGPSNAPIPGSVRISPQRGQSSPNDITVHIGESRPY
jgi:hypothetical protein